MRSNVVKDIFDVIFLFINEFRCVFLEPKASSRISCQGLFTQFFLYLNLRPLYFLIVAVPNPLSVQDQV